VLQGFEAFRVAIIVLFSPIVKFTTVFGLLAVQLAVSVTATQGAMLSHILAGTFLALSMVFVYRSFYGMRIESGK
jgi:K(+)-stimulated pyrophosphate-energized sodium pump